MHEVYILSKEKRIEKTQQKQICVQTKRKKDINEIQNGSLCTL